MGIAVLGPLRVDGRQVRGRRDRAVLAALAVHAGGEVRTERLYEVLWGESPPASAAKVVQGCVVRLRRELGAGAIETTPRGYRLALPGDEVDAARFTRAVARGAELVEAGAHDRAAAVLSEALTWWRGEPLPELEDWAPGRVESDRLNQVRLQAEELYVEAELHCGRHDGVLAKALSMVEDAPLRERRWLLLARAHYQAGRQGDALQALRRLREVLVEELGLDVSAEAAALEEAILRQDPSLTAEPDRVEADTRCPYPGLLPYDVDDSAAFFGRDPDVAACLRRLRDVSVVAVVGPSGSGKSSVVRAGVAAALRRDDRRVVILTPGEHPMRALAAVVGPARSVLVVDQCEEAFSLCQDLSERTAFLDALVTRVGTGPLVVSLRADHLGDLAGHPSFARVVERGLYLLGAMGEAELRAAIEGPARRSGLLVEPGLIDLLVNEVERQPGALPMLSHTLSETWKRREGRTLTLAAYQQSGGIRGAVAMTAEAVYASGDEEHRAALRDVMLRLVSLGEDGIASRTRLTLRSVVHDRAHDEVLQRLIAARLVTSDDGVVELAHEALVRAWPRLGGWLEEDVDGQRIRQHLTVAAEAWEALGRPESELYRGARLAAALSWRRASDQPLPEAELRFLEASERSADAERLVAEERARRQARSNRSLRQLLVATLVLLLAASVAGTQAVRQTSEADSARLAAVRASRQANRAATAADARRLGALALTTDDVSLSMLLAVAGLHLDDSEQSRANLVAAVARHPELALTGRHLPHHLGSLAGDGASGILASSDGANRVVFMARNLGWIGTRQVGPRRSSGHFLQVAFDPPGTKLAAAPEQPEPASRRVAPTVLDTYSHEPTARQPVGVDVGPAGALDLTWSGDGRYLAAAYRRAGAPPVALVWDVRSSRRPRRVPLRGGTQGIALDRSGSVLFASDPLAAYDVRTGRALWRTSLNGPGLDLASTGRLLALPHDDGLRGTDVLLARTRDGSVVRTLTGHADRVTEARFAPDARTVAAAALDGQLLTWRVADGRQLQRLQTGTVSGLAFSHLGSYVMTTSSNGAARLWDLEGLIRYVTRLVQPRLAVDTAAVSVPSTDGRAVASAWTDRAGITRLRLLDLDTKSARTLRIAAPLRAGAWSSDRTRFIAVTGGEIRQWDRRSGRALGHKRLAGVRVAALTVTPGGQLVVASTGGRLLRLAPGSLAPVAPSVPVGTPVCCLAPGPGPRQVTVATGAGSAEVSVVDIVSARVRRFPAAGPVLSLAVSPVSGVASLGTADGQLEAMDLATGRIRREVGTGHEPPATWTATSTDGRRVATTADDGTLRLWDGTHAHLQLRVGLPEADPVTATFLAGDRDLLLTTRDGGIYRWDTSPGYTENFACALAGRSMTRAEWRAYVGRRPYARNCARLDTFYDNPTRIDVGDVNHVGPNKH